MRLCPAHATTGPGGPAPRRVRAIGRRPELALFVAAYLLYTAARWIFVGHLAEAREHADRIIGLERSAHVAIEGSIQRALDSGAPSWLLSNVYLAAQLVVLPGALIWLYRRSRPVYRALRNTVIATWLIAVPIFALFPVAPPRLAGIGIADTVSSQAAVALTGHSTLFYNPYAAVPSLHVGFAFAIGIAAAAALRAPWARTLALLWGPVVTLSVLATGNHYVFDVAAGLLVTAAGFAAGRSTDRLSSYPFGARGQSGLAPVTRSYS
jgi:membrane-associated phospholipid phosphatase